MANRNYAYQYETSPRKIKPEYNKPKKSQYKKQSVKKKETNKVTKNKKQDEIKNKKILNFRVKFAIFCKAVLIFGILFFVLFRNSQISEAFSKIQSLKSEITSIQKENDQLEINIQNSININNIEKEAKELLGMQKLTNKQTVYISLPKKDYVEHRTEEVIIEEEKSFFEKILEKIIGVSN